MESKNLSWLIVFLVVVIAICVVFALFTGKINPNNKIDASSKSYEENLKDLKNDLSTIVNGDYTIEQGKTMQADADCPTSNDQFNTIYMQIHDSYVVFYYPYKSDDGIIYPNLTFRKVGEDKLSLDGVANATLECKRGGFLGLGTYNWSKAYVKLQIGNPPKYQKWWGNSAHNNVLSLYSNDCFYWNGYNHPRTVTGPSSNEQNKARSFVRNAIREMVENYFLQFENLRLQTQSESNNDIYKYLNTYFAYLYNTTKIKAVGTTSVVNVNDFLTYDIPTDEQKNYPIPESKKADYPSDWTNYKMYKCDKYTNVVYELNDKQTIVGVDNLDPNDGIDCDVVPIQKNRYSILKVQLNNKNDADISAVDFSVNPVKITFSSDNQTPKLLTFVTIEELKRGCEISLLSSNTYNYSIESNALVFDNISGRVKVLLALNYTLSLDYTYLNNAVLCSFGLNSVGSIDLSDIDLSINPVTISLQNGSNFYNLEFDNNKYIGANATRELLEIVLPYGTYTFSLSSNALTFPSTTGQITISAENRIHLFNYVQKTASFSLTLQHNSGYSGAFGFAYDSSVLSSKALKTPQDGNFHIYKNGTLLSLVSCTSGGTLSDGKVARLYKLKSGSFVVGETYIFQLSFASADGVVVYNSEPLEFTYADGDYVIIENWSFAPNRSV